MSIHPKTKTGGFVAKHQYDYDPRRADEFEARRKVLEAEFEKLCDFDLMEELREMCIYDDRPGRVVNTGSVRSIPADIKAKIREDLDRLVARINEVYDKYFDRASMGKENMRKYCLLFSKYKILIEDYNFPELDQRKIDRIIYGPNTSGGKFSY